MICFVAHTLQEFFGNGVGRNGGDEFLFCLPSVIREEMLQSLLKKLHEGFLNKETNEVMGVPCSIGVTFSKAAGATHASLIKNADQAMYQTKDKGKNGFSIV